jgi:hypothetical protein
MSCTHIVSQVTSFYNTDPWHIKSLDINNYDCIINTRSDNYMPVYLQGIQPMMTELGHGF